MADRNRKTAYSVLWDVERKGAYANLALNAHIEREKPDNPAFVRELVYGVLENGFLLDWEIEPFLKQPIEKLGVAEKILLRLGFWQIAFSGSIPVFAAVNGTVDLAKDVAKGREGFVNAVLRNFVRAREAGTVRPLPDKDADPVRYLSIRYSAQKWIVRKWIDEYGFDKAESMLAASLQAPPLAIRPNTTRIAKAELARLLAETGLTVTESRIAEGGLTVSGGSVVDSDAYQQGLFSIQEETSLKAVEVLDPKPGETVYDVCAAPGGKTLAIWERMETKGVLVACDVNEAKLGRIRKEAKRLGLRVPRLVARDAATGRSPGGGAAAARAELFLLPESADRVLVDAPCSGLGMLARKPEIKLREPAAGWEDLPEKQRAILRESAKLVKPGGTLVYSTCTVSRTENSGVVRAFLAEEPGWTCVEEKEYYPVPDDGTDGFYIAHLVRKGTL